MNFLLYPECQCSHFEKPYRSFWVDVKVFEQAWSFDDDYFMPSTNNHFNIGWFNVLRGMRPVLQFGRACFSSTGTDGSLNVKFSGGRHRTRWMIDYLKLKAIPLGLDAVDIDDVLPTGRKHGLIQRELLEGEVISLPYSHKYIINKLGYSNE